MTYTTEQIGRVIHEANRALQLVQSDPGIPVALPWDEIDEDMRASVVDGVEARISGYMPDELHANWCSFRRAQGWVYGPVKDEVAKTHPCLIEYSDLPEEQKVKDDLFSNIVDALK